MKFHFRILLVIAMGVFPSWTLASSLRPPDCGAGNLAKPSWADVEKAKVRARAAELWGKSEGIPFESRGKVDEFRGEMKITVDWPFVRFEVLEPGVAVREGGLPPGQMHFIFEGPGRLKLSWMKTRPELEGQGIAREIFRRAVELFPEVTQISAKLEDSNRDAYENALAERKAPSKAVLETPLAKIALFAFDLDKARSTLPHYLGRDIQLVLKRK